MLGMRCCCYIPLEKTKAQGEPQTARLLHVDIYNQLQILLYTPVASGTDSLFLIAAVSSCRLLEVQVLHCHNNRSVSARYQYL